MSTVQQAREQFRLSPPFDENRVKQVSWKGFLMLFLIRLILFDHVENRRLHPTRARPAGPRGVGGLRFVGTARLGLRVVGVNFVWTAVWLDRGRRGL